MSERTLAIIKPDAVEARLAGRIIQRIEDAGFEIRAMVGHIAPEASRGGPIAAVQDGDVVVIDAGKRTLNLELGEAEIQRRMAAWRAPSPRYADGVFAKYARLVSSASTGAVTG